MGLNQALAVRTGTECQVHKGALHNDESLEQGSRFFERRQTPLQVPKLPENLMKLVQDGQLGATQLVRASLDSAEQERRLEAAAAHHSALLSAEARKDRNRDPNPAGRKGAAKDRAAKQQRQPTRKASARAAKPSGGHLVTPPSQQDKHDPRPPPQKDSRQHINDVFLDSDITPQGQMVQTLLSK